MGEQELKTLFDFSAPDSANGWQTVNDGVMVGISDGKFRITTEKTLTFFGTQSLENNGGFASVRTKAKTLGFERGDTLVTKLRGDDPEYMLNLYLNKPQIAYSYRPTVRTKRDEWIEVKIPLDRFEATSFGRQVKDALARQPSWCYVKFVREKCWSVSMYASHSMLATYTVPRDRRLLGRAKLL